MSTREIVSRRIHHWSGQQDILGTSGKSYQCDQLAQWQIGQSGTEFQFCKLQAAADAEGELSYIRLSLRELVGETIPLQHWQEVAAQIPSALVLDSRGVYDALARSESACLGLKDKRSGLEALSLKRSLVETRCGLRWTHSASQLADCMTKGSEEAQKPFELLKRRGWKWRLVFGTTGDVKTSVFCSVSCTV